MVSIHIVENVHRLSWVGLALDWVLYKARSLRVSVIPTCSDVHSMPSPVGATPKSMGTLKRILDVMTSPSSGFVSGAVSAWLTIPAMCAFCTSPFRGYRTRRVAVWRWLLLVDPRTFRVPGPAAGLGCVVCPGVAREPSAPRASLGALARCPARPRRPRAPRPACPAARPSDLSGTLRTGGAFGAAVARCPPRR